MMENFSVYLIPPLLTLIVGLFLGAVGLLTRKRILFGLVCIWYALLTPLFLLHAFIDDADLMLTIERWVHFLYVYFPLIQILFSHQILRINRPQIVWASAVISFLVSTFVPTNYYFDGFIYYQWGYIAKGGIAFAVFGVYGFISFLYCSFCFIDKMKRESNPQLKLKYGYLLLAFGLSSILTLLNVPAINGIDFYPFGNFAFIPLSILAYGIFRYRVLEARIILKGIGVWFSLAFFIVTPHYLLLRWLWPKINGYSTGTFAWVAGVWFIGIYIHSRLVFKIVWFGFYRQRQRLKRLKQLLLRKMPVLGNMDNLIEKVTGAICKSMPFPWLRIYLFDANSRTLTAPDLPFVALTPSLQQWLLQSVRIIEMSVLMIHSNVGNKINPPRELLRNLSAEYLIPLIHDDGLIGVLVMPPKSNRRQIFPDEAKFFMEIIPTFSMALSNAAMYQHVLALKERLQDRTVDLTKEVDERIRVEKSMQTLQKKLQDANFELENAILQANEMTAKAEISNYVMEKEMAERKTVEEALKQSEERYRLIAENSTDVIWTIDLNGRFTFSSPSIKHLLGYTPEEILQHDISKILTAKSHKIATGVIEEELKRDENFDPSQPRYKTRTTEIELVRKDGSVIWAEVNTCFIRDSRRNITGILGVTRDISSRKESERELIHMAYHDALTGLYNRKAFYEQLAQDIQYAKRYNTGLALLMLDLNKFKHVNDAYGHHVGDLLLKNVAERMRTTLRETDQLARLGGDEFTVILKTPDRVETELVVRRISAELSAPVVLDGIHLNDFSASIGMAVFPEDGRDVDELVRNADVAMYLDKKRTKLRQGAVNQPEAGSSPRDL